MKTPFIAASGILLGAALLAAVASAQKAANVATKGKSETMSQTFGKTASGKDVHLYRLKNKNGIEAALTDFGATLVSLKLPDRDGKFADVVLGYDDALGYENGKSYFGATVGRYANRIAKGQFTLDGVKYQLPINNGANSLHGGNKGYFHVLWTAEPHSKPNTITFHYLSRDGEEGYPGNLNVQVTYTLTENNDIRIEYSATTDKDTVVNLTNHSYFNLTGDPTKDVLNHRVKINASRITPVDSGLIPTGELKSVKNTPFDFTSSTAIGARIKEDDEQLKFGGGYDHNFVLDGGDKKQLISAAEVYEPGSGRVLEVSTTEPGLQFYSGNFLDGTEKGKGGVSYGYRTGFCLETQHFPDSPNRLDFPSTVLKKGQTFRSTTIYHFGAR